MPIHLMKYMKNIDDKLKLLRSARENFITKIELYDLDTLNHIPPNFNNNLIWNFGHVIVTQTLLTYGLSKMQLPVDQVLVNKYRKGTKPETKVSHVEVDDLKGLAISLVDRFETDYTNGIFEQFYPYQSNFGLSVDTLIDAINFNNAHEAIHLGFCNALIKFLP